MDITRSWSSAQIGKAKRKHFIMQQVLSKGMYKYIKGTEWFHGGLFT